MDVASLLANLATGSWMSARKQKVFYASHRHRDMRSDKPITGFVENSGVVGKRAWMLSLNAVGLQGLPLRMFVA